MNPILHLFRKDSRHLKSLILLWLVLLGIDLCQQLLFQLSEGAIYTTFKVLTAHGYMGSTLWSQLLSGLIVMAVYLFALILPSLAGLSDSPSAEDGFLSSRPVRRAWMIQSKLLFVTVWVVVPLVTQEAAHLTLVSERASVVIRGSFERFLNLGGLAFSALFFSLFWANSRQWVVAICTWTGCYIGVIVGYQFGVDLLVRKWNWDLVGPMQSDSAFMVVWALVLGLAFVLVLHLKHRLDFRMRILLTGVLVPLISCLSSLVLDSLNPFPILGDKQALIDTIPIEKNILYPRGSISANIQEPGPYRDRPFLHMNLNPRLPDLPRGWFLEWRNAQSKLVDGRGKAVGKEFRRGRSSRSIYQWSHSRSQVDLTSMIEAFDDEFMIATQHSALNSYDRISATFTDFESRMGETVRLQWEAEAAFFEWQKLGEMSLKKGAVLEDEVGSWRLLDGVEGNNGEIRLLMERRQPWLYTAPRVSQRKSHWWPYDQYQFILYIPDKNWAMEIQGSGRFVTFGSDKGYVIGTSLLYYSKSDHPRVQLDVGFPMSDSARLVVFHKKYQGTKRISGVSNEFRLSSVTHTYSSDMEMHDESLSIQEYRRRMDAVVRPSSLSDRSDVARFLVEACELIELKQEPVNERSPVVMEASAFAGVYPDLFLDGMEVAPYYAHKFLISALTLGIREDDKLLVMERIPRMHRLTQVLVDRGWIAEAKPQLLELMEAPMPLSIEAVRCIAWFEDPVTYPRLLEELETHPSMDLYQVLKSLDGMESRLDEVVRRIWNQRSRIHTPSANLQDSVHSIALAHGMRPALEEVFRLLQMIRPEQRAHAWGLLQVFREGLHLDILDPSKSFMDEAVFDVLDGLNAGDFVYRKALGQFVLRKAVDHETSLD